MIHLISDHVETLTLFLLPVSPPDLCGCLPTKESWSWALSTVLLTLAAVMGAVCASAGLPEVRGWEELPRVSGYKGSDVV